MLKTVIPLALLDVERLGVELELRDLHFSMSAFAAAWASPPCPRCRVASRGLSRRGPARTTRRGQLLVVTSACGDTKAINTADAERRKGVPRRLTFPLTVTPLLLSGAGDPRARQWYPDRIRA